MKPTSRGPLIFISILVLALVIVIILVSQSRKNSIRQSLPDAESVYESIGKASFDTAVVQILESFPVQANLVVTGQFPDGCTRLDEPVVAYMDETKTFVVNIDQERMVDAVCTGALVPFSQTIPLTITGFPAGEYRVIANGFATSFTLTTNNTPTFEADK